MGNHVFKVSPESVIKGWLGKAEILMDDKTLKEEQLTLELLDAIEKDSDISQRHLAKQMGIALGWQIHI